MAIASPFGEDRFNAKRQVLSFRDHTLLAGRRSGVTAGQALFEACWKLPSERLPVGFLIQLLC